MDITWPQRGGALGGQLRPKLVHSEAARPTRQIPPHIALILPSAQGLLCSEELSHPPVFVLRIHQTDKRSGQRGDGGRAWHDKHLNNGFGGVFVCVCVCGSLMRSLLLLSDSLFMIHPHEVTVEVSNHRSKSPCSWFPLTRSWLKVFLINNSSLKAASGASQAFVSVRIRAAAALWARMQITDVHLHF